MTTHKLLFLPGDGIGPEVMREAEKVARAIGSAGGASFECETARVGGTAIDADGVPVTDDTVRLGREADAILLGAVGGPRWDKVPYAIRPEAGLLRLRKDLGLFANLRPAICYPALASASSLKSEVVRGSIS
jgi:3-isopropylmalate dehydrogenase